LTAGYLTADTLFTLAPGVLFSGVLAVVLLDSSQHQAIAVSVMSTVCALLRCWHSAVYLAVKS